MVPTDDGGADLGRVPGVGLGTITRRVRLVSILLGCGYLGVNVTATSPRYLASQKMMEADRLAAAGHIGEAAKLLAAVAMGPTALDRTAAQATGDDYRQRASKPRPEGLGVAFRAAMDVQKAGRWRGSVQIDSTIAGRRWRSIPPRRTLRCAGDSRRGRARWPQGSGRGRVPPGTAGKGRRRRPVERRLGIAVGVDYESKGELKRARRPWRRPHPARRARRGADTRAGRRTGANRLDQAIPLLRTYTTNRLERLGLAETHLRSALPGRPEANRSTNSRTECLATPPTNLYRNASGRIGGTS